MKKPSLRFLISGGGTGGHIFPALSIADALRERFPDCVIHFVGAKGRMEMERVPAAGYSITGLWISGIDRSRPLKNVLFPIKFFLSLARAFFLIQKFKPQLVIGTGGFASGSLLSVAGFLGVPTLIQEQNSYPGLTNRKLGRKAKTICVAYEGLEKYFPKHKILLTGNPVRKDLTMPLPKRDDALRHFGLSDGPVVLILGGSLGAKNINKAVERELMNWLNWGYRIIWQTGKLYYNDLKARIEPHPNLWMNTFVTDMPKAYAAADVVLSRAGAGTLSELAIVNKPAILVPSPNVADDHQTKNAQMFFRKGAASIITEAQLPTQLGISLKSLMETPTKRVQMTKAMQELALPKATENIVIAIETLLKL